MFSLAPDPLSADVVAVSRIDVVPSILEVICRSTGMGFAAVARVTEDRWIACAVHDEIAFGLQPGGELQVQTTLCNEIRCSGEAVIIDHVTEDPQFRHHHTPAQYGFQSYISVPIIHHGAFFGTLCAIDPRPAKVNTPHIIGMFTLFADLIARHLEVQEQLALSEAALLNEREAADLREQFIAVLGHDLRNPLAAIDAGARLLRKTALEPKAVSVVDLVQSSVGRMAKMIDDILDLARGRLGGGIDLRLRDEAALDLVFSQVVEELRSAHPQRTIDTDFRLNGPVVCDAGRLAQLLSNLVANALAHGDASAPVKVRAEIADSWLRVSVANQGPAIPAATRERLFRPFTRAAAAANQQGLGLGLYIVSEIARAHGGQLEVSSSAAQTEFSFHMPTGAAVPARLTPPSWAADRAAAV